MEPSQTIQDRDKLSNSLPEDLSLDFFEYEQGAGSNIVLTNKLKGHIQLGVLLVKVGLFLFLFARVIVFIPFHSTPQPSLGDFI